MGWSLRQFFALDDDEQDHWRAIEIDRSRQLDTLLGSIKEAQYVDAGALVATLLARLG
jgi:hypothetical protein